MPNCGDANFLQGLVREARKNCLVYLVAAECRLIPVETEPPQPTPDVHNGRPDPIRAGANLRPV